MPNYSVNGFLVDEFGVLQVAPGPIAGYSMGLPFTSDGRLVCQINQPVSPGDAYVGGIRVGPLGGVYLVDLTPPAISAFSTGYDEGFS